MALLSEPAEADDCQNSKIFQAKSHDVLDKEENLRVYLGKHRRIAFKNNTARGKADSASTAGLGTSQDTQLLIF
jgi:hypothetical protein